MKVYVASPNAVVSTQVTIDGLEVAVAFDKKGRYECNDPALVPVLESLVEDGVLAVAPASTNEEKEA